jgi:hypothetical protein
MAREEVMDQLGHVRDGMLLSLLPGALPEAGTSAYVWICVLWVKWLRSCSVVCYQYHILHHFGTNCMLSTQTLSFHQFCLGGGYTVPRTQYCAHAQRVVYAASVRVLLVQHRRELPHRPPAFLARRRSEAMQVQ